MTAVLWMKRSETWEEPVLPREMPSNLGLPAVGAERRSNLRRVVLEATSLAYRGSMDGYGDVRVVFHVRENAITVEVVDYADVTVAEVFRHHLVAEDGAFALHEAGSAYGFWTPCRGQMVPP